MHILYLEWNSYANSYIKEAFINRGHFLNVVSFPASDNCKNNPELCKQLVLTLLSAKYDICFSVNFFPVVAVACKACNIKYVSWTYDSPYAYLYSDTIFYETNYAFIFDRAEVLSLNALGANTVYHLPMAVPTDGYHPLKKSISFSSKFNPDISMIGSMYSEKKHKLINKFNGLDSNTHDYIYELINNQKYHYGEDVITEKLTPAIVEELNKYAPLLSPEDEKQTKAWIYSRYFLDREVTRLERHEIIDSLSQMHNVTLYTHEKVDGLTKVNYGGVLDYVTEAPLAMKNSKINLNISLRSIISGIPLRAFDILGAGGFLLTNFQPEYLDYFVPNKDLVLFDSLEDLCDKVEYYLKHDDKRIQIAESGRKKVYALHTYNHRIAEIERIVSN